MDKAQRAAQQAAEDQAWAGMEASLDSEISKALAADLDHPPQPYHERPSALDSPDVLTGLNREARKEGKRS